MGLCYNKENIMQFETFDDFLNFVVAIGGKHCYETTKYDEYFSRYGNPKPTEVDPYIMVEWSTGGICGGSCWDTGDKDNHEAYTSSDPVPELELLDSILEKINPHISFLQYKKLCQNLIEYDNRVQNEYYGNCTNYSVKKVNLKKLYQYLIDCIMINQ